MALSYASNLGHIPPINGLYAFVFNPFIYGLLGTCPQMVVGPEAAGSLLVGQVVRDSVDAGESSDDDNLINAQIAGVVTGMAGALILVAGLFRLGYVDSVLSRPFLRGFISAIGFVILIGQLIPEMGLAERAKEVGGVSHGSSVVQIWFLLHNLNQVHRLSCGVGLGSLAIIMVLRCVSTETLEKYAYVAHVKVIEEASAVACSVGSLLSRPIYHCRPLNCFDLEAWLGQERSRDPRGGSVEHRISIYVSLPFTAFSHASRSAGHEHFVPHRLIRVFRVFCRRQKPRWR